MSQLPHFKEDFIVASSRASVLRVASDIASGFSGRGKIPSYTEGMICATLGLLGPEAIPSECFRILKLHASNEAVLLRLSDLRARASERAFAKYMELGRNFYLKYPAPGKTGFDSSAAESILTALAKEMLGLQGFGINAGNLYYPFLSGRLVLQWMPRLSGTANLVWMFFDSVDEDVNQSHNGLFSVASDVNIKLVTPAIVDVLSFESTKCLGLLVKAQRLMADLDN